MAIVLRLEGLTDEAESEDIRDFFHGLRIPQGAVHIIGGELGEAFILFTSEKDAQLAMRSSGNLLKGSLVTLHLSSIAELKQKLSGLNLKTSQTSHLPALPKTKSEEVQEGKLESEASVCNPGYLCLYGLPHNVNESDIRHFLHGLGVQEVLVNVCMGDRRGCLVKVASESEVKMGLRKNGKSLTSVNVEVRRVTHHQWTSALMNLSEGFPDQTQTVISTSEPNQKQKEKCIPTRKRPYPGHHFSTTRKEEHYVMIRNLQPNMTKTEIKSLLGCPHLENNRVQHLLDKNLMRTCTAFVAFDQVGDYVSAMNLSGIRFGKQILDVSSVTKEKMFSELCSNKKVKMMAQPTGLSKTCLYVRNLPADVLKAHIQDIFNQFPVEEEHITLLKDNKGNGLGEAVLSFGCVYTARRAWKCLDRRNFMGNEIILTLITPQQLDSMLAVGELLI